MKSEALDLNFTSKREGREEFYVEDITDYELNKEFKTFGLKVFKELLDVLSRQEIDRNKAKFALVLFDPKAEVYVEITYFRLETDAEYARRKLRKISRLSFRDEYKLSVSSIKDIDRK